MSATRKKLMRKMRTAFALVRRIALVKYIALDRYLAYLALFLCLAIVAGFAPLSAQQGATAGTVHWETRLYKLEDGWWTEYMLVVEKAGLRNKTLVAFERGKG